MTGRPRADTAAEERSDELRRGVGRDLRQARVDAGVTRAEVARAAGLSASTIGRLEAGRAEPDFETLVRTASALGQEISIKLFPSGRPIHDRYQAPMLEAFLGIVDPRWRRVVEVPVVGVTRGAIDCVLGHPTRPLFIAGELHSQVGRVEAILRHANDKAEALRHSPFVRGAPGARIGSEVEVSQLLVLRSTSAVRATVRDFERTFAATFPARTIDALDALRDPNLAWPGAAIIWIHLHGRNARVLDGTPRFISIGR